MVTLSFHSLDSTISGQALECITHRTRKENISSDNELSNVSTETSPAEKKLMSDHSAIYGIRNAYLQKTWRQDKRNTLNE